MATEDGIDYSEAPNLTGRSMPRIMSDNLKAQEAAIASPENKSLQAKWADPESGGMNVQVGQVELDPEDAPAGATGEVTGGVAGGVDSGLVIPTDAGNPYMDEAARLARAGAEKERAGIEASAAVEAMKSGEKAKAMSKADLEATTYALKQKTIEEELAKMDREFERRNIADEEEVRRAYQQRVDPSRYWANKDAGQKAMSVIAAGLFGYLGKGMEYLKRLDNLVAEDVRLQEHERANKIAMAEKIQAKHGQNYKTLRDAREQAYENSLRAESKMWMGLKHTLEAIDVAHAGQAAVAQKFVALAHVDQQHAKVNLDLAQLRSRELTERANAMERAFSRQQDLELKREALGLKKQKAEQGVKLPAPEQLRVSATQEVLSLLQQMRDIAPKETGAGKLLKSVEGQLGGEAKEKRNDFELIKAEMIRAFSRSAIQGLEKDIFGGPLPSWNDWTTSTPRRIDGIMKRTQDALTKHVKELQTQGYAVDPEAYQIYKGASQTFKSEKDD